MGFETQEEAERWAENMEQRADELREERLLRSDLKKQKAWLALMELPAYALLPETERQTMKAVFEYGWEAGQRALGR